MALLYAFGLGYSLFFFGEDYIKVGLRFLCLLILAYIFIDFPLSFFKALLLPKTFDKDKIIERANRIIGAFFVVILILFIIEPSY